METNRPNLTGRITSAALALGVAAFSVVEPTPGKPSSANDAVVKEDIDHKVQQTRDNVERATDEDSDVATMINALPNTEKLPTLKHVAPPLPDKNDPRVIQVVNMLKEKFPESNNTGIEAIETQDGKVMLLCITDGWVMTVAFDPKDSQFTLEASWGIKELKEGSPTTFVKKYTAIKELQELKHLWRETNDKSIRLDDFLALNGREDLIKYLDLEEIGYLTKFVTPKTSDAEPSEN